MRFSLARELGAPLSSLLLRRQQIGNVLLAALPMSLAYVSERRLVGVQTRRLAIAATAVFGEKGVNEFAFAWARGSEQLRGKVQSGVSRLRVRLCRCRVSALLGLYVSAFSHNSPSTIARKRWRRPSSWL